MISVNSMVPKPGEIRAGNEIGKSKGHRYVWHACAHCGKTRWVELRNGKPRSAVCANCVRYFTVVPSVATPAETPKPITFRCRFCGETKLLDEMRFLSRFFPLLAACRECERKWG